MDLHAKIKAKYLDEILAGRKRVEYRQFENIHFTDEAGRTAVFGITNIIHLHGRREIECIKKAYPDVPWIEKKDIYGILIGLKTR